MSDERKTVEQMALGELLETVKENRMTGQQNPQQPQPQLAPEHANALQQMGLDPARVRKLNITQFLAFIQALIAAFGGGTGTGGTGGSVPPS